MHNSHSISAETNLVMVFVILASAAVVALLCAPVWESPRRTLYSWLQLAGWLVIMASLTAVACYLVSTP